MLIKRAFQTHAHTTVRDFLLILFLIFLFVLQEKSIVTRKKKMGGGATVMRSTQLFSSERSAWICDGGWPSSSARFYINYMRLDK